VLKVFASPRARGNHRRLRQLAATSASSIVPRSIGTDPSGHVHLIHYQPGRDLQEQPDASFVSGTEATGRLLRRLHDCGAVLDRTWDWQDELEQLAKQAPLGTIEHVRMLQTNLPDLDGGDIVCGHRDCHPKQIVLDATARAHWIDLDDSAMAPRALDLGNMLAHLRQELLRGARDADVVFAAERAFLHGYGPTPDLSAPALEAWRSAALLRLAGLAATRRADPQLVARLLTPTLVLS
jgi:Ser/Thr protein kinase RdoA (MazF antagonist)